MSRSRTKFILQWNTLWAGGSESTDQRPYHIFLLWASDPPTLIFLAQIGSICGFTSAPAIADVLTWPRNHDRASRFSGQDCVSGHLLVIYQVKRLLDLDFIHQTRVRRTTKTRKELPGKSSVGLRPPPPGLYFGNVEVKDLNGRTLLKKEKETRTLKGQWIFRFAW